MTIYTLCGAVPNDADCGLCLEIHECRLLREQICKGCIRTCCSAEFKRKRVEQGMCRGRELVAA